LEGLEPRDVPAALAVEAPAWWSPIDVTRTPDVVRFRTVLDSSGLASQAVQLPSAPAGMTRLLDAVAWSAPAPAALRNEPGSALNGSGLAANVVFTTRLVLLGLQNSVSSAVKATRPDTPLPTPAAIQSEPGPATESEAGGLGVAPVAVPVVPTTPDPQPAQCATDARSGLVAATDGELLRRFATDRDQAAFTELVRRYGRAVLAASARVLGDADRALDASQVTFAALARRAAALEDRGSLAGWLHQVARRMALRLRAATTRQRRLEQVAAELYEDADDTLLAVEQEDVFRALREELERLPEKYRVPLALCYLDGLTHAEVGRAVSLPRGSVAKRIGEGLAQLRGRLTERGFLS
jgi:RNA polymerase sigma factor (sigma-70 family)